MASIQATHLNNEPYTNLSSSAAQMYHRATDTEGCIGKIALFPVTLIVSATYIVAQLAETTLRVALAVILYIPYYFTRNDHDSKSSEFNFTNFYEAHLGLENLILNFFSTGFVPYFLVTQHCDTFQFSCCDSQESEEATPPRLRSHDETEETSSYCWSSCWTAPKKEVTSGTGHLRHSDDDSDDDSAGIHAQADHTSIGQGSHAATPRAPAQEESSGCFLDCFAASTEDAKEQEASPAQHRPYSAPASATGAGWATGSPAQMSSLDYRPAYAPRRQQYDYPAGASASAALMDRRGQLQ
jgi:hypothetical protein